MPAAITPVPGAGFSLSDLVGQFVVCRDASLVPPVWPVRTLGAWALGAHPGLPVVVMQTSDGAPIGWLIGYPIDPSGRMVQGRLTVPCTKPVWCDAFEDAIYRLGGRWVAVLISNRAYRVYLDAGGSMGAVFSPAHEMVSSTTTLIPYARGCNDDLELVGAFGIPLRNGQLPFGLTPRRGVSRLLPNHYLDLDSWQSRRHWPVEPLEHNVDPEQALTRVAAVVKRHIGAVVARRAAYAGLTAGFDSRVIAACAREHLDRIQFITLALPNATARTDCDVAERLARRAQLSHRVVPFREPTRAELEAWLWRTGGEIGDVRGWRATATCHQVDPSRAELTGQGGELCRASYWREARRPRVVRTADVLRVLHAPESPRLKALAQAWVDDVPARDPIQIYDFLFLEQRLGCWAGVLPYADADATAFRVYPLVHREIFTQMLRLPNAYKADRRFPEDLVAAEWPRLLGAPFNRAPGHHYYVRTVQRHAWLLRRRVTRWSRAALALAVRTERV